MTIDIRVRIDEEERSLDAADAEWVHRRLQRHDVSGLGHRIQVRVHTEHVNVILVTSNCQSAGGGRAPSSEETEILDLWRRFRLGERAADLFKLWPFLMCLRSSLGLRAA